jgi:hypothetical protein
MTIASGVAKQLRYKVEATYGTAPGTSGGQLLRRVTSDLDLSKDTYQSNEIRSDYQIADFRHGVRRIGGTLNGELSGKTYADFFAAALRRDFAAVSALTGLSVTIAVGSLSGGIQTYTVTRGSGDFLTGGVKAGDVVRLSVGTLNAANINKNLLVLSLTATVLTVIPLNGVALVAEGPIASTTVTVIGKKTYVPTSGHTDKSFAFEHWYSDISLSELYLGCKISTIDVALPPTGMATVALGIMGQDIATQGAVYFTAPTAATGTGIDAAVNGVLCVAGVPVAICTGAQFRIDGGYSGDPVVGSNKIPFVFPGRVHVNGQLTAYFENATMRDYFINESEVSLMIALTADNSAAADFLAFTFPRIKPGGFTRSDGEQGIVATMPFEALYNSAGGAGVASEQTTLSVQDAQA